MCTLCVHCGQKIKILRKVKSCCFVDGKVLILIHALAAFEAVNIYRPQNTRHGTTEQSCRWYFGGEHSALILTGRPFIHPSIYKLNEVETLSNRETPFRWFGQGSNWDRFQPEKLRVEIIESPKRVFKNWVLLFLVVSTPLKNVLKSDQMIAESGEVKITEKGTVRNFLKSSWVFNSFNAYLWDESAPIGPYDDDCCALHSLQSNWNDTH